VAIEARFTASSRSSGSHRNWTHLYRASNRSSTVFTYIAWGGGNLILPVLTWWAQSGCVFTPSDVTLFGRRPPGARDLAGGKIRPVEQVTRVTADRHPGIQEVLGNAISICIIITITSIFKTAFVVCLTIPDVIARQRPFRLSVCDIRVQTFWIWKRTYF
jgi:hypothetical protein